MILLLTFLVAAGVSSLVRTWRLRRGCCKAQLVASMQGLRSDAPDGIGVSVLCRADSAECVERLLETEYARYEVVAVVDGTLLETLAARYRMIDVGWSPTGELRTDGVRRVMRSRRRCFRRLVLVDFQGSDTAAMDAAAEVASHDYLIPVRRGWRLRRGSVEQLVAEIAMAAVGEVRMVACSVGPRLRMIEREAVVEAGGFGRMPWRRVGREHRRNIHVPLVEMPVWRHDTARWLLMAAVVLAAGLLVAAAHSEWRIAAAMATAVLIATAAAYQKVLLVRYFDRA